MSLNRRDARKFAMEKIYQMELSKDYSIDFVTKALEEIDGEQKVYVRELLTYLALNSEEIHNIVLEHSRIKNLSRMLKTDLAIIELAIMEQKIDIEIPVQVSVNEATELSKVYGNENNARFVNGILRNIFK
ncbi:MAG: transcription antitermination factor NusB [Clostridia bacterium]|nr:transcription antitermination factor NusB [Clostridia bacterium]